MSDPCCILLDMKSGDGARSVSAAERRALAERWRVLGERLRERSPAMFSNLVEMLAASALSDDGDDVQVIDGIYRVH